MFPYTLSDNGLTIFIDGRPRMFSRTHGAYKDILSALDSGDHERVRQLTDVRNNVAKVSMGRVQILDNTVLVGDREVTGRLVDRILEMVARGSEAIGGYVKFLDNLMMNPSKTAVDELYLFIEACSLPITPEGNFLAYKRVGGDYMDLHSGSVRNMIGDEPSMDRNEVDDIRDHHCSRGLHFCSYDYLPHYGNGPGNRVMIVEINPANVVSIPSDYNNAKGRTWTYKVVGEIDDWEGERITPWFTSEFSDSSVELSDDDTDEYCEDDFCTDCDELVDECVCGDDDDLHRCSNCGNWLDQCDCDEDDDDDDDTHEVKQKLSAAMVADIKRDYLPRYHRGETTLTAIAREFDVHRETIARIDRGDIWSHVTV